MMMIKNGLAKVYLADDSGSTEVWCRVIDWTYGEDKVIVKVLDDTGIETIKKNEHISVPMVLILESLSEWLH